MSARRIVLLLVLLQFAIAAGCGRRPAVGDHDQGVQRDLRPEPDIGPPQSLDVLVVATQGMGLGFVRGWGIGQVLRLRDQLAGRLQRTAIEDVHFAIVSPLVLGKSRCQPNEQPGKAGMLHPDAQGQPFTKGDAGRDALEQHLSGDGMECALQNYLEVVTLALDGRNPGFPRPNALLLILIFTSEDDCSIDNMSLWKQDAYWPANYDIDARCYVPPLGFLHGLDTYPRRLLALHPQRILVAVTGSSAQPVFMVINGRTVVKDVCAVPFNPSPRLAAFVDGIGKRSHPRLRGLYLDMVCPAQGLIMDQVARAVVDFGSL